MKITIIDVTIESKQGKGKGAGYQQAEITYKDEGGSSKSKKIMSFANPAVFALLKDAKKGDVFEITSEKQGEYWQWTSATVATDDGSKINEVLPHTAKSTSSSVVRSNYETPEERAARQRLIVRQSSLGHAVETLSVAASVPPAPDDVLELATLYHDWVYEKVDLFDEPNELSDDIPY